MPKRGQAAAAATRAHRTKSFMFATVPDSEWLLGTSVIWSLYDISLRRHHLQRLPYLSFFRPTLR
ncbi:hypothetical protein E2C01_085653 [Portunus trituberculatus]|uniref:Uncharacterized protein n=1 Tax=Portunus trituberculatus TaxID=210409 RepID=A0A5B7J7F8_PORTR|nr:hypothetical protein [Portunus trituberculatus]